MPRPLVSDELWSVVQPLLPPERPKPKGGRPVADPRACLLGILFVLESGRGPGTASRLSLSRQPGHLLATLR
ncbi:MAG: transposase [Planctomycetes bacterium]|nr:transposase [Planctomycetota bacterium]